MAKRKISGGMKVRVYPVLRDAIEAGVIYGWTRAHKHTQDPDEYTIKDAIEEAVVNEICERFSFDNEDE